MTDGTKRVLLAAWLIAGTAGLSNGQPPTPDAPAPVAPTTIQPTCPSQLAHPRATVKTFMEAMEADQQSQAQQALDLPAGEETKAPTFAFRLKSILDRAEDIDYSLIPDDPNHPESYVIHEFSGGEKFEVAKGTDGAWRFTSASLEAAELLWPEWEDSPLLNQAAQATPPFPDWLRDQFPKSWRQEGLILPPYQWVCLLAVIFLGLVADHLTRWILANFTHHALGWFKIKLDAATEAKPWKPMGLLANALVWLAGTILIGLPGWLHVMLLIAVKFYAVFAGIWTAYRLIDLLSEYLAQRADATKTKFDDLLVPLISRTLKIFATCVGAAIFADAFDMNPMSVLGGLGIGGVAIAFAAKDTIGNVFGAITMLTDRPFEIGDWIALGGVEGTVESVGIRSTRVRTFYNSLVILPNSLMATAVVDNYGRRRYRRLSMKLNVECGTTADQIDAYCEGIRELILLHPYTRKDYYHVYLNGMSASSLDVLLYCFFDCPDWSTELRERHRMLLDILRLAEKLNVSFAFPTRTLHLLQQEEAAATQEPAIQHIHSAEELGRASAAEIAGPLLSLQDRPGPVVISQHPHDSSPSADPPPTDSQTGDSKEEDGE
ncbi:MAG: mechanosensitive ion channel family protein [Planctomycetales bacterium]